MMIHSVLLSKIEGITHAFLNHQESIRFVAKGGYISIKQIHSSDVWVCDDNISPEHSKKIQADAIVCHSEDKTISIITADCIPLIIASSDAEIISVVHAGWKGLAQGIIKNTLTEIQKLNVSQSELFFCIGPHILPCCYEIKEDLIQSIKETSSNQCDITPFSEVRDNGSRYLSLARWCHHLLTEEGVSPSNIESISQCTYCSAYGYGSYRRRAHREEAKSFQYSWIKKRPAVRKFG
ncbi:polyphenol oxidase family protein [Klebsiella sp. BIGb0407]|uniref:polyphenol oxidase family protein n=1 Tax=Klebsiella sp. BIGb0407 TaxID=2940603 RepID=UPI002169BE8E|nr:polyphenol oxidase family protein [Klebsiella sp. BIGb0407]MCS3430559.1 YfiH family protein [Klebsiella sp. BIGb0407]